MLQCLARGRNGGRQGIVMAAGPFDDLIADGYHDRKEKQMQSHPRESALRTDQRENEDADENHDEQKARAAAGMEPALRAA